MTTLHLPSGLVDTHWLKENLHHPQLIILDASAHMPGVARDAYQEWQTQRIPKARFFDFNNKFADTASDLPHMLPSASVFTTEARALGINQDSVIVIYDSAGIFSAPRAWWMFLAMGHTQCAVLDGGLPEWMAQGGTIETGKIEKDTLNEGNFIAHFQTEKVKDATAMEAAIDNTAICILDARSKERFDGTAAEPRAGLLSGHIPSSKNLPFNQLLRDGKFIPLDEIETLVKSRINEDQQLYASCGSGITACVIAFAAHLIGIKTVAVYDGSWCEWGDPKNNRPVHTTK